MDGSLFNDTYLLVKDPIKLNNALSTCLISDNKFYIILNH